MYNSVMFQFLFIFLTICYTSALLHSDNKIFNQQLVKHEPIKNSRSAMKLNDPLYSVLGNQESSKDTISGSGDQNNTNSSSVNNTEVVINEASPTVNAPIAENVSIAGNSPSSNISDEQTDVNQDVVDIQPDPISNSQEDALTTVNQEPENSPSVNEEDDNSPPYIQKPDNSPSINQESDTSPPINQSVQSTESVADNIGDQNPTGVISSNSTDPKPVEEVIFYDETTFEGGLNNWDPNGIWGKYYLDEFPEDKQFVPRLESSPDDAVFISIMKMPYPNSIRKSFSAMPHGNTKLTITSFVRFTHSIILKGDIKPKSMEDEINIFKYTSSDLEQPNTLGKWFNLSQILPNITKQEEFEIILYGSGMEDGTLWAIDTILVEDRELKVIPTTQAIETTTPSITNSNVTFNNIYNATNPENNDGINSNATNNDTNNASNSSYTDDQHPYGPNGLSEVKQVAKALWDAFYVFLALFIACLIALIVLIVKQRYSEEGPPAAVATYNPRQSSYRLDKVYDNPSYDTNQV